VITSRATAIAYAKDAIRRGVVRNIREGCVWVAVFSSHRLSDEGRGRAARRYVAGLLRAAGIAAETVFGTSS